MMRITVNNSTKWFFVLFIICAAITILSHLFLPKKFFYDAILIVEDPYNEKGFIKSYPITMMFYHITGLKKLPFILVGILQLMVYFYFLAKIGVPKNFSRLTLPNIFIYSFILMMGIFIAMPSKEFINFVFFAVIILFHRRVDFLLFVITTIFILIVYGIFFRVYYALIPLIAIPLYLISNIKGESRVLITLILSIIIVAIISYIYSLVTGESFSDMSKLQLNIKRMFSQDANSMIMPPFRYAGLLGELINSAHGYLSVNLPINAIKHYQTPRIIIFMLWQIIFTVVLYIQLAQVFAQRMQYPKVFWLALVLISFFAIQGIFEPDLGSAIRHKIGVLPLIYFIFYYDKIK